MYCLFKFFLANNLIGCELFFFTIQNRRKIDTINLPVINRLPSLFAEVFRGQKFN